MVINGPNSPGSYAILLFTASGLASITSPIHKWVCFFLLWLHPFILSGVISLLISSSILGTYRPGEFLPCANAELHLGTRQRRSEADKGWLARYSLFFVMPANQRTWWNHKFWSRKLLQTLSFQLGPSEIKQLAQILTGICWTEMKTTFQPGWLHLIDYQRCERSVDNDIL